MNGRDIFTIQVTIFSIIEFFKLILNIGRIKAVQLEYSDARKTLVTALRKAPQTLALGFRQAVSFRDN